MTTAPHAESAPTATAKPTRHEPLAPENPALNRRTGRPDLGRALRPPTLRVPHRPYPKARLPQLPLLPPPPGMPTLPQNHQRTPPPSRCPHRIKDRQTGNVAPGASCGARKRTPVGRSGGHSKPAAPAQRQAPSSPEMGGVRGGPCPIPRRALDAAQSPRGYGKRSTPVVPTLRCIPRVSHSPYPDATLRREKMLLWEPDQSPDPKPKAQGRADL